MSYGEKCNSELLDFYGYILEENPNDCVHLDLDMKKDDPLQNEKSVLYGSSQIE